MCASDSVCRSRSQRIGNSIPREEYPSNAPAKSVCRCRSTPRARISQVALVQFRNIAQKVRPFACGFDQSRNASRCSHRKINVVPVAVGHLRISVACGRFDVIEISATDRFDEFAVDKILDSEWLGAHGEAKRKPSSSTPNVFNEEKLFWQRT